MAKSFKTLRDGMPPEARQRSEELSKELRHNIERSKSRKVRSRRGKTRRDAWREVHRAIWAGIL